MKQYIIIYSQIGSTEVNQTVPMAGRNKTDVVQTFRNVALDPFDVIDVIEQPNIII